MSWVPISSPWEPDTEPAEEAWLAEIRVELRRVRAPERLRLRIAAMLAQQEDFPH
jgi:hypothetical protein